MTAGGETHEAAAWSAAIFARRFDVHPARVAGRPDCNLHEPDPPAASRYDDRRCGASERGAVSQEGCTRAGWRCAELELLDAPSSFTEPKLRPRTELPNRCTVNRSAETVLKSSRWLR